MVQAIHKIKDYEIFNKIIDTSEFGSVHKARNFVTSQTALIFVLSSLKVLNESKKNGKDFMVEMMSFQKIKGENLLNITQLIQTENHFYLVYEFSDEMNLQSIIDSKGPFQESHLISVFTDILLAYLPYFVSNKLHQNILSKNIYKSNNSYKILNFPVTQSLKTKVLSSYFYYKNGVPPYEILENYLDITPTNKVDVWAIGIVFYELVTGVVPFEAKDKEDLLEILEKTIKNKKKFLNELPNPKGMLIKEDLQDLLEKMLQLEPEDRLDFKGVLEHPFFKKKKQNNMMHICEYFKQTKFDLDKKSNVFQTMKPSLLNSLKKCFDLLDLDPLKINELDILETLQEIPNDYGASCKIIYKIQLMEETNVEASLIYSELEKSPPKHGDFPFQARIPSHKNFQCKPPIEDEEFLDGLGINSKIESDSSIEENSPTKIINEKHEKILQQNISKMDSSLEELKSSFKLKISHEISILRFVEDINSTLHQAIDSEDDLKNILSFILCKYLYIRADSIKNCLDRKENIFMIENWNSQLLYLNFDYWIETLKKLCVKFYLNMNSAFEKLQINAIKDKKLVSFLNFNTNYTASDEKMYIRVFLKLVIDIKDLLEAKNQNILSKFSYGVVLKLLYFIRVYEKFGFFKCDCKIEADVLKMSETVTSLDKEKIKKEIVQFFKNCIQNK